MGSTLSADQYLLVRRIWLSYPALAGDGVPLLALNGPGDGPATLLPLKRWVVGPALGDYYGVLADFLAVRNTVRTFAYDWRMATRPAGELLAAFIDSHFGENPVHIVGHSLGGLVARAAMRVLAEAGRGDQVVRLVTLGTPHYGSLSFLRVLGHLDFTYLTLAGLVSLLRGFSLPAAIGTIDPVLGTWVSPCELLPWRYFGPLSGRPDQAAAVYTAATYARYQPFVQQIRLDTAIAAQTWLHQAGDPARTVSLISTGLSTATQIADVNALDSPFGYFYSDQGDGQVPRSYAQWQGAAPYVVHGVAHHELPYSPVVLAVIEQLLAVELDGLAAA